MSKRNSISVAYAFDAHNVRTVIEDGESWFSANDVCTALGFVNPRLAVADHVDPEDVSKRYTPTAGGRQLQNYINESGLYALIFGSTKDTARKFKKWVTSEVLPAIRKHGEYQIDHKRARHAIKATTIAQDQLLQQKRGEAGKDTQHFHYANEHLMINEIATGQREPIDRDSAPLELLDLLAFLEIQNIIFIGNGMPYDERKLRLHAEVPKWRARQAEKLAKKELRRISATL